MEEKILPEKLFALLNKVPHLTKRGANHKEGIHPAQWRVLSILIEKNPLNQGELLEVIHVRPSSISEILGKLEEKEYIVRTKDEEDKRATVISLTEAGQNFWQEHKKVQQAKAVELFEILTPEEQATLYTLLERLSQDWEVKFPQDAEAKKDKKHGHGRHHHHGCGAGEEKREHHHSHKSHGEKREGRRHHGHKGGRKDNGEERGEKSKANADV